MGEQVQEDTHPLLVTILAIFHLLIGFLWTIIGFTLLFVPSASERFHDTILRLSNLFNSLTNDLMGLLFLFSAALALSVGWAFWTYQPWARFLSLIMVVVNISFELMTRNYLDLSYNIVILVCLFHPTVSSRYRLNLFSSDDG